MSETAQAQRTAGAAHYTVSREDLPLHCPPPGVPLWSMHPRVYLDVLTTGQARCPYCSTIYELKD